MLGTFRISSRHEILHATGFLILVILAFLGMQAIDRSRPDKIAYSRFETLLAEGKVREVAIGKNRITGLYRPDKGGSRRFVTDRPRQQSPRLNSRGGQIKLLSPASPG